tara:strand:- start:537 stop:1445 length:909 start_codon:yes stop_codon:yes gene_type:complete
MALTKISTGGVKDDAASQAKIADEAVDEARLQVSNAGTNGQFLSKQTGNTGGLTWATVTVPDADKVIEGNTSVEAVDTGSDGHVKITTEGTERVRVDENGRILVNTTTPQGNANADDFVVATTGHAGMTIRSGASHAGNLFFADGVTGGDEYRGWITYNHSTEKLTLGSGAAEALAIDSSQNATFAGTVSDSKGDLRNIPINSRTAAYTLVVGDAGKVVGNTTGGWTIPAGVFTTVGQTVTLLNNSGSAQNITASALTYLYNTADGVNIKASTIALGARAMATIWFDGGATGYIQSSKITVS